MERDDGNEHTRILPGRRPEEPRPDTRAILMAMYEALQEKGYDPVRQIAYFLLTGEPAYITAHKGARSLAHRLEREEVIETLLRHYLGV